MSDQTKTKQPKYYNLSEVEKFLEEYADWYEKEQLRIAAADDSNPPTPPPPPPGTKP